MGLMIRLARLLVSGQQILSLMRDSVGNSLGALRIIGWERQSRRRLIKNWRKILLARGRENVRAKHTCPPLAGAVNACLPAGRNSSEKASGKRLRDRLWNLQNNIRPFPAKLRIHGDADQRPRRRDLADSSACFNSDSYFGFCHNTVVFTSAKPALTIATLRLISSPWQ